MDVNALKRLIVEFPKNSNYATKGYDSIFHALYYYATNEGEFIREIFPHITNLEEEELLIDCGKNAQFRTKTDGNKLPFYLRPNGNEKGYTHPANKTCSRELRSGEPVYRCEECGYDDTCVLCLYCFNPLDHVDHNVQMYYSEGISGGICDCGDPEAFPDYLNCKCQLNVGAMDFVGKELHPDFQRLLRETIEVVLDYILDVTNFNTMMLPFVHDNVKGNPSKYRVLSDHSSLPTEKYGGAVDENSENKWHLLLWNDEYHDYPETEAVIKRAFGVSSVEAHKIAEDINNLGKEIVNTSTNVKNLLGEQAILESVGLITTIISARDYARNCIVSLMVDWLEHSINYSNFPNLVFQNTFKSILGELLLSHDFEFSNTFPSEIVSTADNLSWKCYQSGLLLDNKILNECNIKVKAHSADKIFWFSSPNGVLEPLPTINYFNSRIQFLMLFEIRFDKCVRKKFLTVFGHVLISDLAIKSTFSMHLIQVYPVLFTAMALADREDHLSFLNEICTQTLTCPNTVRNIIRNHDDAGVGYILGPLISLIEEHSSSFNSTLGFRNMIDMKSPPLSKHRPIANAIKIGIRDFAYMIEKKKSGIEFCDLKKLLQPDNLVLILLYLRFFQGFLSHKRKYGNHVEHEVSHLDVLFRVAIPVLNVVKFISQTCVAADTDFSFQVTKFFVDQALLSLMAMNSPGVASFQLSRGDVGFHNPINSLISYLIQYEGFKKFSEGYSYIRNNINKPFMHISDYSLRSIVFSSQVKVGFWIRNGYSLSRLSSAYQSGMMNDISYIRDLHLNQVAAIIDEPSSTLKNFLARWELYDWFTGEVTHEKTIYEERFFSIAEEFISFVYHILVDRSNFRMSDSKEERKVNNVKVAISYTLVSGPNQYSKLKKLLEDDLSSYEGFDDALRSVASYTPPSGLTDSGMYRLKPELFNDLDPLNLELDTAEFQEISEILIKEKEKSNVDKKKNVILTPKFIVCDDKFVNESIGRFTKTKEFVKLTYKFLQVAIDTKDETYISQLLHLLHAIFLDDGNLRGDRKYLSEEFVNIPICDLLLTIVDSTMSRNIINKAEYLLDFMISADNKVIESLRSCFGDAHITDYLSKKAGTTESEAEKRKRIADARKMKVMKKFAKQRENFLANNKDLSDVITKKKEEDRENENEDAEKSDIYRHCVVCGEAESKGKTFGIFASFNSQEFWKLPYDDLDHAGVAFKDWDHQELRETNNDYGKGFRLKPTKDSGNRKQFVVGKIITTCGHGAHESCDPGSRSTGYLPCPLCNVAYTFMLPSFSFPKGKGGVPVDLLNGPPKFTKYNQIIHSIGFKKPEEILKYAGGLLSLDPHYSGINDKKYTLTSRSHVAENMDSFIFKDEMERDYLQTRYGDTFNCILKFGAVIADTIRMHEILNRIDGNDAYTNFLGEFPVDVKYLLKALILARCCTIIEGEKHLEPDYVRSVNFFWDTLENDALSGIFSEVVLLYLQTDESFLTMTRFGYIKLFAVTTYALLSRAQESKDYGALYTSNDKKLPSRETLDSLRTLALNYFPNFEGFETDTFLANLYFTVEKCMLPFLRQMIILKDILTSTFVGHKEWESIDELRNLEEEISDQEHVDLSHILCKKLGLPYLEGLVVGLDVESIITTDYDFTFERSIFDIMVNAKIPKFSQTILCLDYPGVTKLIDLPDDFGASIYKPESEHHDFRICLGCGDVVKVENGYVLYHTVRCSSYFLIFFHTRLNTLEMYCKLDNFEPGPLATSLAAPYLTEHGEVRTKSAGKATLNRMRYKYLNKLWMTQGLQKVIFRALFGQRFMPMGNEGDLNVGGMGSDDEGEDEDEDEERDDFSFGEGNVDDIHFN